MNADKWWDDAVQKLRRMKGLCSLTREEAEAELKKVKRVPISESKIDAMVKRIVSGQVNDEEPATAPWCELQVDEELESELLQLNRHGGEENEETTKHLNELREKLLNDDDDDENTTTE